MCAWFSDCREWGFPLFLPMEPQVSPGYSGLLEVDLHVCNSKSEPLRTTMEAQHIDLADICLAEGRVGQMSMEGMLQPKGTITVAMVRPLVRTHILWSAMGMGPKIDGLVFPQEEVPRYIVILQWQYFWLGWRFLNPSDLEKVSSEMISRWVNYLSARCVLVWCWDMA